MSSEGFVRRCEFRLASLRTELLALDEQQRTAPSRALAQKIRKLTAEKRAILASLGRVSA
jgi:hypothetical protein